MPQAPLSGRRVLITAGPTWVPLDSVRHIGNFSTGATGLEIARSSVAAGASVTLLLGPTRVAPSETERRALTLIEFVTFDELHSLVREQVGGRSFDVMVHAAAVSDFRPAGPLPGKLASGEPLTLRLEPTPKIVDEVKHLDPAIFLVKFKLEVGRTPEELIEIARRSRERSGADLMVANDLASMREGAHPAYLIDEAGVVTDVKSTTQLAARLLEEIARRLEGVPLRAGAR
jgi:phosphopantothenoylcysteine decarboxylase / phosphopantothenate---cysteine ligase